MHLSENALTVRFTRAGEHFNSWTAELLRRIYPTDAMRFHHPQPPEPVYFLTAVFLFKGDLVQGCAALYHNPGIAIKGYKTLLAGNYEAVRDEVVADVLLTAIENYAAEHDYQGILGPMNGSTWADYRFVTGPQERPFFTEPFQHRWYEKSWRRQGFENAGTYYSSMAGLPSSGAAPEEVRRALLADGIVVRPINTADLSGELRQLYPLVSGAFSHSPYYTPIAEAAFVAKFLQLQTLLDADCTLIAFSDKRPVGFVLCLPDYYDSQGETLVLKTIARLPGFDDANLISRLGDLLYRIAAQKGYRRIIHAFMQADNRSRIRSSQFGGVELRRYALFWKTI